MFQFSGKPCLLESMVLKVHTLNITNYDIHIKKKKWQNLKKIPLFLFCLKPIFCGSFFLGSESSI